MIDLFEAPPGSGKTNYVVNLLMKVCNSAKYENIYSNIDNLNFCFIQDLPEDWRTLNPEKSQNFGGALIVIDESQLEIWLNNESKLVDDRAKSLSEHRHYGIDFWLICTNSGRLNKYVTDNIHEHILLYRPRNKQSVRVYSWSIYQKNFSQQALKNADDETTYFLNKEMFKYYKSTALVTDGDTRKSNKFFTSILTPILMLIGVSLVIYGGLPAIKQMYSGNNQDVKTFDDKTQQLPSKKSEQLEQVDQVDQVERVERVESIEQVEQFESIEQVEQVESIEQVEQVESIEQVKTFSRQKISYVIANNICYAYDSEFYKLDFSQSECFKNARSRDKRF